MQMALGLAPMSQPIPQDQVAMEMTNNSNKFYLFFKTGLKCDITTGVKKRAKIVKEEEVTPERESRPGVLELARGEDCLLRRFQQVWMSQRLRW